VWRGRGGGGRGGVDGDEGVGGCGCGGGGGGGRSAGRGRRGWRRRGDRLLRLRRQEGGDESEEDDDDDVVEEAAGGGSLSGVSRCRSEGEGSQSQGDCLRGLFSLGESGVCTLCLVLFASHTGGSPK
jgi:hypothetical protein